MALTDNLLKILDHVAYGYSGKALTLGIQELLLSDDYKKKLDKKLKKLTLDKNATLPYDLLINTVGLID